MIKIGGETEHKRPAAFRLKINADRDFVETIGQRGGSPSPAYRRDPLYRTTILGIAHADLPNSGRRTRMPAVAFDDPVTSGATIQAQNARAGHDARG